MKPLLVLLVAAVCVVPAASAAPPFWWWTEAKAVQALAKTGVKVSRCGGLQPSLPKLRPGQTRPATIRFRTFMCRKTGPNLAYVYVRSSKKRPWGFCRSENPVTEEARAEVAAACP